MPSSGSTPNVRTSQRARRIAAVLSITAIGAGGAFAAGPAQAGLLGGVLPNLGSTVTNLGQTVGGLLPGGVGGVVTGVTGTVGGVVGGVQDTVTGTVDSTLGNVLDGVTAGTGGVLPTATLDNLLSSLGGSGSATGTVGGVVNGVTGAIIGGQAVGPNGVIDASAPRPTVQILSRLKAIGRNGKLKIKVTTNEAGIVALAANVRPGAAVKTAKKAAKAAAHSRKLIKVPSVVLGYRGPGTLTLTVKLSRAAQRVLGSSRDARASIGTVAADVNRNQASDTVRIKIAR